MSTLTLPELTLRLKAQAHAAGFALVGVVPARPSRELAAYLAWIDAGLHGSMGYMARPDRVARRQDLNVILPGVQTIVCVALDYFSLRLPPAVAADPARGRIANYAWGADYHTLMTPRLQALAAWLAAQAGDDAAVQSKVYVDTGALLERSHAAEASLGFTGKNTLLINARRGSFLFLGEILTTLPLTPDALRAQPSCGACTRCLSACPTDAFPRPYVLDARRCISYLTIEHKGAIARDLRPLIGNWVYGCDICQDVCPWNRFSVPTAEAALWPVDLDAAAPPLVDLLALDAARFQARFAGSPMARIGRDRLVRNACIAAGNWGDRQLVPLLDARLRDAQPLVRGHAAWALGQIGDAPARAALAAALALEPDGTVRAELHAALERGE